MNLFLGMWLLITASGNQVAVFSTEAECLTAQYSLNSDNQHSKYSCRKRTQAEFDLVKKEFDAKLSGR